jgi:muramoyltetrapeptide carboxypeptidase LdcA involved in peptidoglycan recycling
MVLARCLRKGDTIGIVSPSWCGAGLFPHRVENGKRNLEKLGYKVVFGKNALKITGYTAGGPEERAADINEFFKNKEIKAIICSIGGNHSNQILPYIDWQVVKNNPKIFCGFSDITVLHLAIYKKTNLVTFYGPSLLNQFAEYPEMHEYTKSSFLSVVGKAKPFGKVISSEYWTEEVLNWQTKKDLVRPRKLKNNPGWRWIKRGSARGKLLGGCISSLLHLRGTPYLPSFKNSILFWEIPEGESIYKGESLANIDSYLMDFSLSGIFRDINGMIVGRPYRYSKTDIENLIQIIFQRTEGYEFPILFNVDIGHTDPMLTIPIGIHTTLDSNHNLFSIDESAVY